MSAPVQVLALLPDWAQVLVAVLAVLAPGWLGTLKVVEVWRTWRTSTRQQDEAAYREMTRQLLDALRAEIDRASHEADRARGVISQYVTEIGMLRQARWDRDESEIELRDAVITLRVMVHDLERQIGRSLTSFPALPGPPTAAKATQ